MCTVHCTLTYQRSQIRISKSRCTLGPEKVFFNYATNLDPDEKPFLSKILVIRAGTHKMLVQIRNRVDPDQLFLQKQSDLGLCCLSRT